MRGPSRLTMDDIAIEAFGLGKRFHIGTRGDASLSRRLLGALGGPAPRRPLWAVRGVSLTLRRGECLGLIGPNGAGKTTLLMLLAGLLRPTEGAVRLGGRPTPFLQIGSGLHAELTVLDNIRLAAGLFGMSRRELDLRLEAIVAFGELEDYLYARLGELSSGFQARVPFCTALHSEVDIILADEVLAVGDAAFSARCLGRMGELLKKGRAAVLASHSMDLVVEHCTRALLLERGEMVEDGEPRRVAGRYLAERGLLAA